MRLSTKTLYLFSKEKLSWIFVYLIVASVTYSNIANGSSLMSLAGFEGQETLGGPIVGQDSKIVMGNLSANISQIAQEPALLDGNVLDSQTNIGAVENEEEDNILAQGNVLAAPNAHIGYATTSEDVQNTLIREYDVQEGDTIAKIAQKFSLSEDTILLANNISDPSAVHAGQRLKILPVNGVEKSLENTTLDELATKYKVSKENIIAFNSISEDNLETVKEVIIPEAVVSDDEKPYIKKATIASTKKIVKTASVQVAQAETANNVAANGYYVAPTTGRNYGVLHASNGVDISNSCGTPIYAAAEGQITTSQNGWNGGYGNYIKIQHPNGVLTLYGHLSSRISNVGDTVEKGQLIGYMGTTGRSTGCHLHFEVRGAKNFMAR
jgi:murein DD-endopeptidase MepM/ murein hydrolase activator NlpD